MTTSSKKGFNFEKSLTELTTLVSALEEGNLPLEDSLKKFEQGIQLTRQCQNALQQAEQKVQILMQNGEQGELADYQQQFPENTDDTDDNSD